MRLHGTLTKWNDERGFGFITPAKNAFDVFVHISAFPREGGRPRLNELISFEIEAGPDGKQRAVRVMRPAQRTTARPTAGRDQRRQQGERLSGVLAVLAVVAIGAYGYSRLTKKIVSADDAGSHAPVQMAAPSSGSLCDGRTMCSQMTSCAEAEYFIRNCPDTKMDGDGDGRPCESQWCK